MLGPVKCTPHHFCCIAKEEGQHLILDWCWLKPLGRIFGESETPALSKVGESFFPKGVYD